MKPGFDASSHGKHSRRQYPPYENLIAISIIILLFMGLFVVHDAAAELAIVQSRQAPLYQDSKVKNSLARDQIVSSHVYGGDDEWLLVAYEDEQYLARKRYFLTEARLRRSFLRESIRRENRLALVNDEIRAGSKEAGELITYIFQVKWDRNIFYQIPLWRFTTEIGDESDAASTVEVSIPATGPKYRYVEKITSSQARKLTKTWHRRLDSIEDKLEKLRLERGRLELALSRSQIEFTQLNKRFREHENSEGGHRNELYIVGGRYVGLYSGKKKVNELKHGDIVRARPNKLHRGRLEVLSGSLVYDTPARSYRSRFELYKEHTIEVLSLELEIKNLKERRALIQDRELLYARFILDLEYGAGIAGEFVPYRPGHWNLIIPHGLYTKRLFPTDGAEIVHGDRARYSILRWRETMYDLHSGGAELESEQQSLEQDLAELKDSYLALSQRFAMNEF